MLTEVPNIALGRRGLLLLTFPMLACTTLAAGLCFLIDSGTARIGSVAFFIFLFAACYSPGEGPIPYVYSAEVFPLAQREQGMAFAVTTCLGWAAVVSITFPRMLIAFKPTGGMFFSLSFRAGLIFCVNSIRLLCWHERPCSYPDLLICTVSNFVSFSAMKLDY
jgi:hypothetical protein